MTLTATLKAAISATLTSPQDVGSAAKQSPVNKTVSLADGTGAGQADLLWDDERTLAGGANEDLDLAGSLADAFGNTVDAARIKGLYIENLSPDASITFGPPGASGWVGMMAASDVTTIRPGGFAFFGASDAAAYAVTAGTGDLLTITNLDGSNQATYRIVIIASSA